MPSIVNGCGTWYHFKRNWQHIQALCPHCGHTARLTSYDTRLFVVVVFIPVIPLGRKRIINECSACTKHMVMPLHDYQTIIERAKVAQAALEKSPKDVKLAREALEGCVPVRDVQQFLAVAPTIEANQSGESETMRLLAAAYDVFGRKADAERVLRLALAAKDEASTREYIANILLDQGKVEEAEPYAAHVRENVIPDRVDLLYRIAQQHQAGGNHTKALEYFQACTEVLPAIEKDELFCRLRDASQAALGTAKAVKPNEVATRMRNRANLKKFGRFAMAASVLIAIGYLALCWYIGSNQHVYLANGLDRTYEATVDGKKYTLTPFGSAELRLGQGKHRVSVSGLKQPVEEQVFEILTPFLSRPFAGTIFAVNPDRCAVIVRETVYYGSSSHENHADEDEFHAGELFIRQRSVDFPFQSFPRSITTQSGSNLRRTRLGVYGDDSRIDRSRILSVVPESVPRERLIEIAWRKLELEGSEESSLSVAVGLTGMQKSVELLRKGLGRRPIDLAWHRCYQEVLESTGQDADLENEYEQLLAASPDDPVLQYLRGRCCTDAARAQQLLEASATAATPCPIAFRALAWRAMAVGEFDKALGWLDRAQEKQVRLSGLQQVRVDCLAAQGRYALALEFARGHEQITFPACVESLSEQLPLYAAMNDAEGGRACIDRLLGEIAPKGSDLRKEAEPQLLGMLDYGLGRIDQYVRAAQGMNSGELTFSAALSKGDLEGARKHMPKDASGQQSKSDVTTPLLMYIASAKAGDEAAAREYLASAKVAMSKFPRRYGAFVRALEQGGNWEEMRTAGMEVSIKRTILTAVGLARPELQPQCFALARKLNFDRQFPYHLIREVVAQEAQ